MVLGVKKGKLYAPVIPVSPAFDEKPFNILYTCEKKTQFQFKLLATVLENVDFDAIAHHFILD